VIVELLTLGDELLDGRRIDTNTAWLGRRFTSLGVPPRFRQTTSDRTEDIAEAFRLALARSDFVVSTGGLGPTADDVTFEALARALGRELEFHPDIFAEIEKRFEERGLRCTDSNRRQAMLPAGTSPIPNEWGTAPGCAAEIEGKSLFCLPGVPLEMEKLFERTVFPALEQKLGTSGRRVERIYKIFGLPESHVEERVDRCRFGNAGEGKIRVAYTASFPEIHVTLSILGDNERKTQELLLSADYAVRKELGEYLFATGVETLEERIVEEFLRRNLRLSVAESFTGGEIASRIVNVAGCSMMFERGYVTYSNTSKSELLGVTAETLERLGSVSDRCAREMAVGARSRSQADWAVATTGIAGPEGGSAEKPVGLAYIAWVGPEIEQVQRYQFRGDRNHNRMLAVYEALTGLIRLAASSEQPKTRPSK